MADWTPEDGDRDEWLSRWLTDGWRREYPWSPTEVVVNGRRVHRFALIRDRESVTDGGLVKGVKSPSDNRKRRELP